MSSSRRHTFVALLVMGISTAGANTAAAVQRVTAAPCPVLRIAESVDTLLVRCAQIEVPQTRGAHGAPGLAPVRLSVVIFARRETPPDATPVLYLTGGPGESAIDDVALNFLDTPTGQALIRQRRIIAFDQRGFDSETREASPWIGGFRRAEADTAPLHASQLFSVLRAGSSSLRAGGTDLRNFSTVEAAADAADVLRALGIRRAILFGASYGTRVAFHIMKDHGSLVEAAVLDGVVPPQATAAFHLDSANAYRSRALERLVRDCRADDRCRALYPRIEKDWWHLARAGAVVRVNIRDMVTGETWPADVRGDYLTAAIGGYLIFEEFRVATPAILSELAHGEPIVDARSGIVPAALRLGSGITTIPKYGLGYLTVLCADAPMGIPQYGGHEICEALGVPFGGRRHVEPVSTAVPTLLLAARYDASSPPEWADLAARTMSAAHVVHIPGTGHVAHTQAPSRACVGVVVATFVRDPARRPDTRCVDALGLPAFPEPPPASTTAVGRDSTAAQEMSDSMEGSSSSTRR